ncbi:c-type cytochrome [Wenzhouxiangella sp. AB-CW3]|uniref:c-type cytochrome n=1 Tax=Wenzhouxiangella sp. AB-CW3 TaxID=2771012 RepID=UPI00168AC12A|nr:cytochrome c [Wenzhouxiangella sp. AB-CW3]QOC22495.1 c-type cytochrome [Wenzhouxiangella sp. AB-CW3]
MRLIFNALCVAALAVAVQPVSAADVEAGETKFKQLCATCHGDSGKGDGPAGRALRPAPPDMSDPAWQEETTDDHIRLVTEKGGPAAGLAPTMTAFGHTLDDDDLDNVVAFIRSLAD